MVNELATIKPRSSGTLTVTNPETGNDFFRPEQLRDVFIFENGLDVYAEVSIKSTHSQDESFTYPLTNEQGLPVLPGEVRETLFTDSNELVRFIVRTPTAPSSGSLRILREKDNTPLPLDSSRLNDFKELNDGRTYATDFQASLADGGTLTAGLRNPSSADVSVFVRQFGIAVGGDALVTTEIDHDSYTDGTSLSVINKKPELQVERPLDAAITKNPTVSGAQESMTAFLPGGVGSGASPGNRFPQADYELTPGQDMTITIQNDSGSSNRFGFGLELIETVVR